MDTPSNANLSQQQDLLPTLHATLAQLQQQLEEIKASPQDQGSVAMIVCRPATGKRRVLEQGELCPQQGLIGDNWLARGYRKGPNGAAHPDMQINLMNARAIAAIAGEQSLWPLAGDQFFVDLDLSPANLPPGTRLQLGSAVIEVTAEPHLGCKKFLERFGKDAVMFVNSDAGKALNLRGINARVITAGSVKPGDRIFKSVLHATI